MLACLRTATATAGLWEHCESKTDADRDDKHDYFEPYDQEAMNQRISSHFDGGAITVLDTARVDDLQVALRPDSHSDIRQWFYFRLQGAAGRAARIRITNACPSHLCRRLAGLCRGGVVRPRHVVSRADIL